MSSKNDWYKRIDEQRKEKAKLAIDEADLKVTNEFEKQDRIKFGVFFAESEILLGKNTNIIFEVDNQSKYKIEFLNYQFQIFYVFSDKLLHQITFLKHIWNIEPNKLEPFESFRKEFHKVDPTKYYLMSDQKGQWLVRVFIEFHVEKSVTINQIYSDAKIKII